jgi:acyl-coenzyme A synthetase/AMP-(fatty) acid ligase
MHTPERRERCRTRAGELLPCLADYVAQWARTRPNDIALIEHDTGQRVTWARFEKAVEAFAAKLLSLGLGRGDVIATSLPFLKEHVFLEYACFRIGVIVAPLDLRLKADEVRLAFEQVRPKAWFFLGNTPRVDFSPSSLRSCAHRWPRPPPAGTGCSSRRTPMESWTAPFT